MKILKADQIRSWDQYTIEHEPIASIDLMERAATKCFEWLDDNGWFVHSFAVFCGKGNNGGDGLAIARMLAIGGCKVSVYILEFGHRGTEDFQTNLAKLHLYPSVDIHFIQDEKSFSPLAKETVVIDALFGSGLTRPPDGITSSLIDHINNSGCTVIAIDVPSGMSVDQSSKGNKIVKANYTLSFQCYKLAFLMAENAAFIGEVIIL
ncbi:MAG TPA: NAD(P)H-hydrate epimerase, partial [Chitinophagaceae bacterium]